MTATSYIVAYLSDIVVYDDSDTLAAGPSGDLIVATVGVTTGPSGTRTQKVHYPVTNWYEVRDGQNVLGWPYPGIGPSLPSGRPWGIPIFALPEAAMGDTLALSIVGLESDSFKGQDVAAAALRVLNVAAGPLGTLAGGPAAGSATGATVGAITSAITESWEDDIIAQHVNTFTRGADWGIGRPAVEALERQDGEWQIRYHLQRVTTPYSLRVRVRINRISVAEDLDDVFGGGSDIYLFNRVWGGLMAGELPEQRIRRIPEGAATYTVSGGDPPVELNTVIFEGEIGPFLSVEIGAWDEDDNEDDMHGMLFGLWMAPDLIAAFRANDWRPLQFSSVSRGAPLSVDFQIEPLEPETIGLYSWWSPSRSDNFTTSRPDWAATHGSARRDPDYLLAFGHQGRLFNPALPQPPGTIKLCSWWSLSRGDNFTTSDPRWIGVEGDTRTPDYRFQRLEGYVYDPALPQPRGTIALYSWWSPSRGDNLLTSDPRWIGKRGDRRSPDYSFVRLEGYVIGSHPF